MIIVLQVGGFVSPTELFSYLFEAGAEPSDIVAERGPDGLWRGSGRIRHPTRIPVTGPCPHSSEQVMSYGSEVIASRCRLCGVVL